MALPTVQWRYVGSSAYTNAINSALDAVYTLGTKTTYYDGSSRTPGSGQASTWSRFQASGTTEAVYATPVTSTALNARWIFAGSSSAKSPTMASPDTWVTNMLLASINKNSGAFNAWDNAAPFTSGDFFGYWRVWPTSANAGSVHMFECEEAVMLWFVRASDGTSRFCCVGAFVNPFSTDAADAETDERLYGVATGGGSANVSFVSGTSTNNASWMGNGTSNGNAHTGVFDPGAATIRSIQRNTELGNTSAGTHQLPSGDYLYAKNNILICDDGSPNNAAGMLREMGTFTQATVGQVLSDGVNDIGYCISVNGNSASDAALLFRNA